MFERVIAADYSESMLLETDRRFRLEGIDTPELIRCDAARLPFQTGSLDAVHAGAALHCWPQLEVSQEQDDALITLRVPYRCHVEGSDADAASCVGGALP